MKRLTMTIAAAVLAVAATGPVQAATIAQWTLLGAPGNQPSTSGISSPNVAASSLTRGAGLVAAAGANSLSSSDWDEVSATPATDNNYISFGFSVGAGYTVDLDKLYIGTRSSGTGPKTLGLYYSADSFANSLYTFAQLDSLFVNSAIDLSALPLLTGFNEFRIIEIGNSRANDSGATASGGTFRVTAYFLPNGTFVRDMQFTGVTSLVNVDSPATLASLLALAPLLVGLRRRAAQLHRAA